MTYSNNLKNQQRHIKKIKVVEDNDANNHNQEQVLCHDFWHEAPDDLLTEIFVRLVNSRLAARASTVCLRWHSLIRQNPSQFIERFKSHHHQHPDRYPPEYSLPWAVVFRPDRCSSANTSQACSDEWLFLHGKLPKKSFNFLPNSSNMHIKASSNDLFLVSHKKNDLYICNPITERFMQLPPCPRVPTNKNGGVEILYSVVRTQPGPTTTNIVRFKVVRVLVFPRPNNRRIVPVAVFCSVSRKWETRSFPCPGVGSDWYECYNHTDIVTVDGVMYWLSRLNPIMMILVYLDLSKDKCGTIHIPWPVDTYIGVVPVSGRSHELRLLEVDSYTEGIVHLKVWRFNNNNNNNNNSEWILVHDKRTLARPASLKVERSSRSKSFAGAFVHPTDGDLVLCVWDKNVIEYNIVDSTYKKIAELSKIDDWTGLRPPFLMVGDSDLAAGLDF